MKTKEELDKLKEEYTTLNKKLAELSEEELKQVSGGIAEKDLIEIAKKQQIDISKNDKEKLLEEMEQALKIGL